MNDCIQLPTDRESIIVEGRFAVEALLQSSLRIRHIMVAEGCHLDLVEQLPSTLPVHVHTKAELQQIAGYAFHRGIIAVADRPPMQHLPPECCHGLVVACPEIADESNLGVIIRNAVAFGVSAVAVAENTGANIYSRKAIRASAGTVFRVPIYESPTLMTDVHALRTKGWTVIGATIHASSIPIQQMPQLENAVLLLGKEDRGLSTEWLQCCDLQVTIPLQNKVDSLNVACSSAIFLYEMSKIIRGTPGQT